MSNRITGRALKGVVAIAAVMVTAASLSGCTALGSRTFGDSTTTGSINASGSSNLSQPMPSSLGAPMQVAENQFVPPENVGGFGAVTSGGFLPTPAPISPQPPMTSVASTDLPALSSSSSMGTPSAMPAQQTLAPVTAAPAVAVLGTPPRPLAPPSRPTSVPVANTNVAAAPAGSYVHVIESGESLYTIARRYDVTAQSIVLANGSISPDKIYVGQRLVIPGRPDLLASRAPLPTDAPAAVTDDATQSPIVETAAAADNNAPAISDPSLLQSNVPPKPQVSEAAATLETAALPASGQPAVPAAEPKMSGAEKFRWPVSGRVITDFAASKATGINIEAPEGAAIKAAENGTVIYVGSGVEGYGNLILIRHPNGYVSAYAHLKSMSVSKGAVVNRGDTIGAVGMTGSVNRPQLHFELRKGATPVDPVPMLAS